MGVSQFVCSTCCACRIHRKKQCLVCVVGGGACADMVLRQLVFAWLAACTAGPTDRVAARFVSAGKGVLRVSCTLLVALRIPKYVPVTAPSTGPTVGEQPLHEAIQVQRRCAGCMAPCTVQGHVLYLGMHAHVVFAEPPHGRGAASRKRYVL